MPRNAEVPSGKVTLDLGPTKALLLKQCEQRAIAERRHCSMVFHIKDLIEREERNGRNGHKWKPRKLPLT